MRPRFDQQLEELNLELIKMGSLCERGIRKAVDLLMEENTNASIKDVRPAEYFFCPEDDL